MTSYFELKYMNARGPAVSATSSLSRRVALTSDKVTEFGKLNNELTPRDQRRAKRSTAQIESDARQKLRL